MKIKVIEIEHKDQSIVPNKTIQTNLTDVERIEIRCENGISYIITPESGELVITKQNSIKGLNIRPAVNNQISIS